MVAFLFPGQGAQKVGMGRDFYNAYRIARTTFEEAEDLLQRKLTSFIFEGPEKTLTQTENSQVAIYVTSVAILRVLQELFPTIKPSICAGLSLGEYTALTASQRLSFESCLPLVQKRGELMSAACEATDGTMAAWIGWDSDQVETFVANLNMPNEVWVANFNTPGQVVISGTVKGVDKANVAAKKAGIRKVVPLQVHGAFHSGLMQSAQDQLVFAVEQTTFQPGICEIVMNVPGDFVADPEQLKRNLIGQVTKSVRWEQSIRAIEKRGVEHYIEIGCGRTLAGMNKRIGASAPTTTIETIDDLKKLEEATV